MAIDLGSAANCGVAVLALCRAERYLAAVMADPAFENDNCPVELANELTIVEREMRRRGFRWTNQRQLIAKVALSNHGHFSAEEFHDLCRAEVTGASRATVYRTLSMLEEAGFVESLDTGDGGKKFEHTLGHEHHDHMVCTSCGAIIEFQDHELERRQDLAAKQHGFQITSHSLKLFGVCRDCHE